MLLVGYPKLLPPARRLRRLPRLRPQDRATFRAINCGSAWQMHAAAEEAGVEFVDFYAASSATTSAAAHPWVQGRVGSSRRGAALHPLPAGQAALARLIERDPAKPKHVSSQG